MYLKDVLLYHGVARGWRVLLEGKESPRAESWIGIMGTVTKLEGQFLPSAICLWRDWCVVPRAWHWVGMPGSMPILKPRC